MRNVVVLNLEVGGIIKDALFDKVTISFDYSSDNFLFFKLNDIEIILSVVYIPPARSIKVI